MEAEKSEKPEVVTPAIGITGDRDTGDRDTGDRVARSCSESFIVGQPDGCPTMKLYL